jgi:DNA-binding MarR family transcriptional regulator
MLGFVTAADPVDRLVSDWASVRPDLDFEPMGLYARLNRFVALARRRIDELFEQHGLSTGEFDVLATLRRRGEPHVMKPSMLARAVMLSPAAMTNRLDRLEAAGLIERQPDPNDRRSAPVALTPAGLALVDDVVAAHLANEARLVAPLTPAQRSQLDAMLRTLLDALYQPAD